MINCATVYLAQKTAVTFFELQFFILRGKFMREFKSFNPYIILLHFIFVVGGCMLVVHPVILFSALLSGGIYALMLCKNALKRIFFLLPTALVIAILNPIFNHRGVTILWYLPSGNPVTLEAMVYGLMSGIMLVAVVLWFMCFSELFKSDKILYVFGKIAPSMSMLLSMALGFVPKLIKRTKDVMQASEAVGKGIKNGNLKSRLENAASIFQSVVGWAMESSVETAKSMKCRGFGKGKRTAYSLYKFRGADLAFLLVIVACTAVFCCFVPKVSYYPAIFVDWKSAAAWVYALVCFAPIIIDLMEARRWRQ